MTSSTMQHSYFWSIRSLEKKYTRWTDGQRTEKLLIAKFLRITLAGGGGKTLEYNSLTYIKPAYQIVTSCYTQTPSRSFCLFLCPILNPILNLMLDPILNPILNPILYRILDRILNPILNLILNTILNPILSLTMIPILIPMYIMGNFFYKNNLIRTSSLRFWWNLKNI